MWTGFSSLPSLSNQDDVKYYSDVWLLYIAIGYRYIDKQFYSLYKDITRYYFFYYNFGRQTARTGPLILWLRSVDGASYLFAPGSSPHRSEPGLRAHYATEAVLQPPAAGRPNLHMPNAKDKRRQILGFASPWQCRLKRHMHIQQGVYYSLLKCFKMFGTVNFLVCV